MKIGLASVFTKNCDLNYNFNVIKEFYEKAVNEKLDLVIFPRLAICGFCLEDKFLSEDFLEENIDTLQKVISLTTDHTTALLIGGLYYLNAYTKDGITYDKSLNDAAFLIKDGYLDTLLLRKEICKENILRDLLYFDKAPYINYFVLNKKRFGVLISDDIYYDDNIFILKEQKLDYIICLDSVTDVKADRLITLSKFIKTPVYYINQTNFINNEIFMGNIITVDSNYCFKYIDKYDKDRLIINNQKKEKTIDDIQCKANIVNKVSELEAKPVLFLSNELNPDILKYIKNYVINDVDLAKYCSLYNSFTSSEKFIVKNAILKNLFKDNIYFSFLD